MSYNEKSVYNLKINNIKKVRFSGCKIHYFDENSSPDNKKKFDRNNFTPVVKVEKLVGEDDH